jgi:quercetin dioxygenase-like cupin family protein
VWSDPVLVGSDAVSLHEVFFTPRSRTYWHVHAGGQILGIIGGTGFVVDERTGPALVRAGHLVWTEPGERPWHGAAPNSYLAHTAISLAGQSWLHEVDDATYDAVAD